MSLETMTKIATTTVGSGGTASVTFSNIPQHYTDLVVKSSARTVDNVNDSDTLVIRFNDSTSNLSARALYGSGSSALSLTRSTNSNVAWVDTSLNTSSTFGSAEWYISNYAGNSNKTVSVDSVQENNATAAIAALSAVIWSDVSPINSITILSGNGYNLAQHSTVTLYGIKNARQTAGNSIKATGGNISFDGTYVYHVYPASGTFTPAQPLLANILLIAGGGGGGSAQGGGGGGGGGIRLHTSQSLTATGYTVTVGAGGTGSGGAGSVSGFTGLTDASAGAGGGAGNGGNGGASGAPTSFAGGTGNVGNKRGGGGGGAGAVGANAATDAGAGGAGINTYSDWASATATGVSGYYAGGGGGGRGDIQTQAAAGGIGGGGTGGTPYATELAGTANTGGGGGGGRDNTNGALGGSGIVIVRYKG